MLVVISDLHFSDCSATPANIPCQAFGIWLDDILSMALANQAQELCFLYLGDIFDLLRTEYWFYPEPGADLPEPGQPQPTSFPVEDRPWGAANVNAHGGRPSPGCLKRAGQILEAIANRCQGQLAMLSGDIARARERFPPGNEALLQRIEERFAELEAREVPVVRYYVPGNHDRLFLHGPGLNSTMRSLLGATPCPTGAHAFESRDYGVIAQHGHERDVWNFEAFRDTQNDHSIPDDAYRLVPIGDAITTELAARAPYLTFLELQRRGVNPTDTYAVYEHLKRIEDVRPLTAAITWMLTVGSDPTRRLSPPVQKEVLDALELVVKRLMADFMSIPFVHAWVDSHDRLNFGLDEADRLQDVGRAIRLSSLSAMEKALEVVAKLHWPFEPGLDECARGAAEERLLSDAWAHEGIRYCVYGHTHSFRHEPLGCAADGSELVYFNSGTWRPRIAETRAKKSFVSFKEMTYLVFYMAGEDQLPPAGPNGVPPPKGLSYETWNGLMRKEERHEPSY